MWSTLQLSRCSKTAKIYTGILLVSLSRSSKIQRSTVPFHSIFISIQSFIFLRWAFSSPFSRSSSSCLDWVSQGKNWIHAIHAISNISVLLEARKNPWKRSLSRQSTRSFEIHLSSKILHKPSKQQICTERIHWENRKGVLKTITRKKL